MKVNLVFTISLIVVHFTSAAFAELKVHVHNPAAPVAQRSQSRGDGDNPQRHNAKPSSSVNDTKPEDDDGPDKSIRKYGVGDTKSSNESYQSRTHRSQTIHDQTGTATVEFEKRTNETRSRTYEERGFLSYKTGAQAQANLVRVELNTQYESPAATIGGQEVARVRTESSTGAFVGAQADAEAGFDLSPSDPRLEAKAGVFVGARADHRSKAEVEVLGASASTTAEGSVSVGVEANANASLSKEGGKAKVGGFAGARAEGAVGGEVGGVGGEARGEAWAGVGAEADGEATFEDGKLTLGGDVGAGLMVGGKAGYTTTVDVGKVHHDGTALVKNGGQLLRTNVSRVEMPVLQLQPVSQTATPSAAFPSLGRAAPSRAYRTIPNAVHSVSKPVISRTRKPAMDTWNHRARQVNHIGSEVDRTATKVTKNLGSKASKAGNQIGNRVKKGGKSVKRTGQKVSKKAKKISKSLNPFK